MNFWKNLHPLLRRDRGDDYGSANYAVLSSLADSLSDAERETIAKKAQLVLKTATGLYLDEWGSWFGVIRRTNENDDDYRERIKWYLLVPRSTIEGIITGIRYYLDDNNAKISVYEPWKNIFYTNKSTLNGPDHLQGFYYRFAVIDVRIDRPMSKAIYDAIMAFKPAGVKWYVTIDETLAGDLDKLVLADPQSSRGDELDNRTGFGYKGDLFLTFGDFDNGQSPTKKTSYFITNDSHMNGEDVLSGSSMHNLIYWGKLTKLGILSSTDDDTQAQIDKYRGVISSHRNTYLTLTPDATLDGTPGGLLEGTMSIMNTFSINYGGWFARTYGDTVYDRAKQIVESLKNNKTRLKLYIKFDSGYKVYVNGVQVFSGFNALDPSCIVEDGNDIYVNLSVTATGSVKLYYIGVDVSFPQDTSATPFTGQGVQVKSEMVSELTVPFTDSGETTPPDI